MGKILFCGFGWLGKKCLEALLKDGYGISFVLTHEDLGAESVDAFAKELGLGYSYMDMRTNKCPIRNEVLTKETDFLVSVNYKFIIPKEVIAFHKYAVNLHGSLLPQYRGRTPHVWSIINGEKYSGVTAHVIEEAIDSGDIIEQIPVKIEEDDTGYSLLKKIGSLYPTVLLKSLEKLKLDAPLTKQDGDKASFYGKRTPDMGYIDFHKNSDEVVNFVRALANPYPGAYYFLKTGEKIIVNKVIVVSPKNCQIPVGVINDVNGILYVACKDSILRIVDFNFVN